MWCVVVGRKFSSVNCVYQSPDWAYGPFNSRQDAVDWVNNHKFSYMETHDIVEMLVPEVN